MDFLTFNTGENAPTMKDEFFYRHFTPPIIIEWTLSFVLSYISSHLEFSKDLTFLLLSHSSEVNYSVRYGLNNVVSALNH